MKELGFKIILLITAVFLLFPPLDAGVARNEDEYNPEQVKANLILKFPSYIIWPDRSDTSDTNLPFIIGVVGDTPVLRYLLKETKNIKIKSKAVTVKLIPFADLSGIEGCHVVFISEFSRRKFRKIMEAVEGFPILTVGDTEDYARRGVMINFFLSPQRTVKFNVNSLAAKNSKISITSKIMRFAGDIHEKIRR